MYWTYLAYLIMLASPAPTPMPTPKPINVNQALLGISQWLLNIMAVTAVLMIVVGAAMLVVGSGDTNAGARVRHTLVAIFFGLLLAFGAESIVTTFLSALS